MFQYSQRLSATNKQRAAADKHDVMGRKSCVKDTSYVAFYLSKKAQLTVPATSESIAKCGVFKRLLMRNVFEHKSAMVDSTVRILPPRPF